ncbi:hypothetical protein ACFHWD_03410 [Clostridium sp. MT-14]|uniref:hypothetical protein n=1 Tax=Clostridium sp. MT-14 TaxID=3348360 RepID=UPI0035F4D043
MSNKINQEEVKVINYEKVYQPFVTIYKDSDEKKSDGFYIKSKSEKIIHSDNRTIVILNDGSKGIAKCNPDDEYNKTKGIKIAYIRAKIKSLNKELKNLVK